MIDPAKAKRCVDLLNSVDEFGVMHIIVSDGNMDDHHIEWVEQEMDRGGHRDADERELLAILKEMTVDERDEAWGIFADAA